LTAIGIWLVMLAFFKGVVIALAESGGQGGGAGDSWYVRVEPYLNYPGFEFWRFFNLIVFVLIMIYLLRKPLGEAFKAKREVIRAELIKAEKEKKEAEAKLAEAEAKLAVVGAEKTTILENAKAEAAAERKRIERETENDIGRVSAQAATEIARKSAQERAQLMRFSARESVSRAEEKIRKSMTPQVDADLVRSNIESIGGLK